MAKISSPDGPSFLSIPCELRMLIYDKLVGDRVFWINFPHDGSLNFRVLGSPAIMRVSKQVREEAQRAVKVRTLRMNKFNMPDVKLFSRIPKVVSHWVSTIETVLIAYRHFEFEVMLGRSSEVRPDRFLTGLKQILVHLPKLVTINITCDDLLFNPQEQDLDRQLSSFSHRLIAFLPQLNHIQIRTERKKYWAASWEVEEVEIKLSRASPSIHSSRSGAAQDPGTESKSKPSRRKVLLDVIKISDIHSNASTWLTIDEVNQ